MLLYILYIIISPLISLFLYIIAIFNYKIRANHCYFYFQLIALNKAIRLASVNKKILLFHASSSGEYEQLKPILRIIDKKKYFIVQSFTSPTIYNIESKNSSLFDVACYHPYDFLWRSWLFFKVIKPEKYIITRHDIWPGHIATASFLKIKSYYINANIHRRSIWYQKYFRSLTRWTFNKFTNIFVPSNTIKNNLLLIDIKSSNIKICDDTRFEQILYRSMHQLPTVKLPKYFLDSNTIIFGSIDDYDEKIIFPAIVKLFPNGSESLKNVSKSLIIVPHEAAAININRVSAKLKKYNFNYILSSELKNLSLMHQNVILVDQVGILAELYKYAKIAYVGGGFKRGIHSILEPAIYNCSLLCGPNIEMLDEAKELLAHQYLSIIFNSKTLFDFLSNKNIINPNTAALFDNTKSSAYILKEILC